MRKKGQITLFVILGLILLIIIGLAIYFFNSYNSKQFKPSDINVPAKFAPVQDYVTQCVNNVLTDGIIKLGLHGGYIDPIDPFLSGVYFTINPLEQYNSDLAFLDYTDKTTGVAYWFETKSYNGCDTCFVATQTPSIYSMEQQLDHYVVRNIGSCLNNFESFKDKGYTINDDNNYTIETSITDKGVLVLFGANIFVTIDNQKTTLDLFYTESDIPLKKYYDVATNITIKQVQNNYLENVGLYLINAYSGLNSTKLPPIHDSSEGYDFTLWSKTSSKQKFQSVLTSNIPVLRVKNSKNDLEINDASLSPSEYYFYNATRLDIPVSYDLSNSEISFSYLGQSIYFDIFPSNGELLMSKKNPPKAISPMFQERIINNYDFYYETSYPVIVEIKDEYKKGSYYTFMFALEANIVANQRIKDYLNDSSAPIPWDPSFLSLKLNYPKDNDVDLASLGLDSKFNEEYSNVDLNVNNNNLPLQSNSNSKFCDVNQQVSGLVTLKTYDGITGNALSSVNVKFGCGNFIECDFGETTYDTLLQESLFNSKFPTCNNGYITLSKQGYLTKTVLLSTDSKTPKNLGSIYLDKIVTKSFNVSKYFVKKHLILDTKGAIKYSSYSLTDNATSLSENDTVIITFEKVLSDVTDEPFGQTVMVSSDSENIKREIMLVPGVYSLNMQLLDNNGIIILKECKTICADKTVLNSVFGGCNEEKKIPEDDIVIKPAPWGGVIYDNQTLVYISASDLSQDNTLELNVMRLPEPKCFDDMEDMSKIGDISDEYSAILLPKFIPNNIPLD